MKKILVTLGVLGLIAAGGYYYLANPRVAEEYVERFDDEFDVSGASWKHDHYPDDGPFSDVGAYFRNKNIIPPEAYRTSISFGTLNWLTAELYTRSKDRKIGDLISRVPDPVDPSNQVIRLASPAHTDAVLIRPTFPLPRAYRISARVGFASFGDGIPGLNGYDDGTERSGPWNDYEVKKINGFYWLSILDAMPLPHNNVWIHHHRKVTIDSANHFPPWMFIDNGRGWKKAGTHPVMMFVVDGLGGNDERLGKPFISFAKGRWQAPGEVRAVDSYKPDTWYTVSITRKPPEFILEISGEFKYGGQRTYRAAIDYEKMSVWHYNQPGEKADYRNIDNSYFESVGPDYPHWPDDKGWPDYFMLGEPHVNFYEGHVLYDDIRLEVLE